MKKILMAALCLAAMEAHAAATDKLKSFITATRSAQANFTQEVQDKNGKRLQSASGTMQFVRPGKFRWEYRKPYAQLIVGDGQKFWMYDADLNQVTVKRLDAALGSSPAALLSGSDEIERGFVLSNIQGRDGLEWLQAKPKSNETTFEKILMAFNSKSQLVVMELHDAFGNHTVLRFSELVKNPPMSPQRFKFVPPKGADVLGE
ncbi:MAG: outer membrane lipoprotein carrier protein LolA [Sideroxydans sp.]|nr:outer membrane lipoprotein carrier protein LolA [Sideroxydans sp.]